MSYNHFTTGHLGLAAILAAILNISNCSKLIFTPPPTENDPWDPYLDESSEKKTLTDKKGFHEKSPLFSLTNYMLRGYGCKFIILQICAHFANSLRILSAHQPNNKE
ncbi:MAG: hypothetical protein GY928_08275 [Colwellia sp.]|nr:hypothetical protein [Colwellia sp.]